MRPFFLLIKMPVYPWNLPGFAWILRVIARNLNILLKIWPLCLKSKCLSLKPDCFSWKLGRFWPLKVKSSTVTHSGMSFENVPKSTSCYEIPGTNKPYCCCVLWNFFTLSSKTQLRQEFCAFTTILHFPPPSERAQFWSCLLVGTLQKINFNSIQVARCSKEERRLNSGWNASRRLELEKWLLLTVTSKVKSVISLRVSHGKCTKIWLKSLINCLLLQWRYYNHVRVDLARANIGQMQMNRNPRACSVLTV